MPSYYVLLPDFIKESQLSMSAVSPGGWFCLFWLSTKYLLLLSEY